MVPNRTFGERAGVKNERNEVDALDDRSACIPLAEEPVVILSDSSGPANALFCNSYLDPATSPAIIVGSSFIRPPIRVV